VRPPARRSLRLVAHDHPETYRASRSCRLPREGAWSEHAPHESGCGGRAARSGKHARSGRYGNVVREGRLELPRPLGHRILRLLALRRDPSSACRPVSFRVVLCPRVSSCREQDVSKKTVAHGRFAQAGVPLARPIASFTIMWTCSVHRSSSSSASSSGQAPAPSTAADARFTQV